MLYAIKGNKQLKIDEAEQQTYLKLGYDIAKANGDELSVIETAPSKIVPYVQYKALLDENEELQLRYGAAQTEIKTLKDQLAEAKKAAKVEK